MAYKKDYAISSNTITFERSLQAETVRALLLIAGETPADLGLSAHSQTELRAQAQNKTLALPRHMSASEFNAFYRLTHDIGERLQDYAKTLDMEISLPKLCYRASVDEHGSHIVPSIEVVRYNSAQSPQLELAAALKKFGIDTEIDDRVRHMDIQTTPGKDLTKKLESMLRGNGRGRNGGGHAH